MTISESDDRYVVFLSLVIRAKTPIVPDSDISLNYHIEASDRELLMLEVGEGIISEFQHWRVIGKDLERRVLTLNQHDLLSPMKAFSVGSRTAMIDWAVSSLVAGVTGEATTLLAGADYDDSEEVYNLFQKATTEQGVSPLIAEVYREWLEAHTCVCYLGGDLTIEIAVHQLHDLWLESDYNYRFSRWEEFYDQMMYGVSYRRDLYPEMREETLEMYFTIEAKRVLGIEL